jgi:hypothetical protein
MKILPYIYDIVERAKDGDEGAHRGRDDDKDSGDDKSAVSLRLREEPEEPVVIAQPSRYNVDPDIMRRMLVSTIMKRENIRLCTHCQAYKVNQSLPLYQS